MSIREFVCLRCFWGRIARFSGPGIWAGLQMKHDSLQLFKYGLITALIVVAWFALTSLSHNVLVEIVLGWIGLGGVVLYWRWLLRNKVRRTKP